MVRLQSLACLIGSDCNMDEAASSLSTIAKLYQIYLPTFRLCLQVIYLQIFLDLMSKMNLNCYYYMNLDCLQAIFYASARCPTYRSSFCNKLLDQ